MSKRMLINARHPEESRVAIAIGDKLIDLEIERADVVQLKGNIYRAAISRIEPSLQAAFVDIGSSRNGFLQINDINHTYFQDWTPEDGRRGAIQDFLEANQTLLVQVVKDERDAKGATLTTNISIPGRYLVLMIGNQRGGVSRKISDEKQRIKLKRAIRGLQIPTGMGVIVRTAGINKSTEELQEDLDNLLNIWQDICNQCLEGNKALPELLYEESDLTTRTIRDYLSTDIDEILIDEEETYNKALTFVKANMPSLSDKIKFYQERQPLFSAFHLNKEVEAINAPEVILPSGGSIVINQTEAIVAIDVNSGRATSRADVEDTAFNTNVEAATEIAKQLKLRDLGGLIVIDFIDMYDRRHKHSVEKSLKEALRADRAKIEVGKISKFGLLEMSRQRMKSSLLSQNNIKCSYCSGKGQLRTPESIALEVLRKTECAISAGKVNSVRIRLSPSPALMLLNSKRRYIGDLESKTGTNILIYADGRMKPNEYELELDTSTISSSQTASAVSEPKDDSQKRDRDSDNRRNGNNRYRPKHRQKRQHRNSPRNNNRNRNFKRRENNENVE